MKIKEIIKELQKYNSELEVGLVSDAFRDQNQLIECNYIQLVENILECSYSDESFFVIFNCKNGNILTEDYKEITLKKAKKLKLIK